MVLTRVISATFDNLLRRVVKMTRYTSLDTQTALEAMPFGVDSNPIAKMVAIMSNTEAKKTKVVVGYINPNQLAAPGETRLFSVDADGNLKAYLWLKVDGTLELLGSAKHMARFEELETAFNQLKSDFNSHVHPGVTAGGASTSPIVSPSTADISGAKAENVKTA